MVKKVIQQGHSPFGARSVLSVREHGKRARTPLVAFFNIPQRQFPIGPLFWSHWGFSLLSSEPLLQGKFFAPGALTHQPLSTR
jgi:hypothetical protein